MFVVVDIEWVVNKMKQQSLTQLSAAKIDEKCRAISWFSTRIKPRNKSFHDWNSVCYRGATPKDFMSAPNAYMALQDFERWIGEEATLLFWYNGSCVFYKKLNEVLFQQEYERKCLSLAKHVTMALSGKQNEKINPYLLAKQYELPLSEVEHISIDDVKLVLKLMRKAKIDLLQLFSRPHQFATIATVCTPYQYDEEDKLLHKKDCSYMISDHKIRGLLRIEDCVKQKLRACKYCMAKEILQMRIKKNLDTISRSQYNYVYVKDSQIFHKCTCGLIYKTGQQILGTTFYQSAVEKGKIPCKVCKPSLFDKPKLFNLKDLSKKKKKVSEQKPARVIRAINRHTEINKERNSILNIQDLTEQERKDIYTLTNPEFSFWAVIGCATFHLRSCPKLIKTSHYKGFKQYSQAIKNGYRPCKTCKPTAKYDTLLSIPVGSKEREGEGVEQLIAWCNQKNYQYVESGSIFLIKTPVGEWNVYINKRPVQLEHNNLVTGGGFHNQPRIFLSLYDAFFYIHKHDKSLMQKVTY